jgi:hypothetical protein
LTGRQTSVVTESQTIKMAGRNKGKQDSNRTTSSQRKDRQARRAGRTATDKKERKDCNRKMGANNRLAERQTDL